MNKIFIFIIMTTLLLSACTPKAYTNNIKLGNEELIKEHYSKAVLYYQNAKKEKDTDEVKELLELAKNMDESKKVLQKGDFETTNYILNKVISNNSNLEIVKKTIKKAKTKLAKVEKASILFDNLKEQIVKGKTLLGENLYDQAIEIFKGISETNQYLEYSSIKSLKEQGTNLLLHTTDLKNQYQDELEKKKQAEDEKRKQEEANKPLTHKQAEVLVKQYLDIKNSNVFVEYDHDADNGDYVIHVYEVVVDDPKTGEGHTSTWGWYGINKNTKIVYDAMKN